MGFENGDIIIEVNGQELNSPEMGFRFWQYLGTKTEIDYKIERQGKVLSRKIVIE